MNIWIFFTGKDVSPEKDLLEKTATIKRFEFLLLSKELKAETDIAKKTISIIKQYFCLIK